jgi:hypothetical protein
MDELTRRLTLMEEELKRLKAPEVERIEIIERPIRVAIPEIARGHEDIYERFLKGVLIYRPQEGSDVGKIEMPIAALANPLEGTFDLSRCDDAGEYLSISTGYRKGHKAANANKVEVWFAPRFLIEKELQGPASHFTPIMRTWEINASVGIFWTWGGSNDLSYFDYLNTMDLTDMVTKNMREIWTKSKSTRALTPNIFRWIFIERKEIISNNFMFIL